ncbi:MAG: hypothetical protein RL299_227 [Pseudomonadota bacterium]|jgi:hypothetical protein
MGMAISGLASLSADDFCNVIGGAVFARSFVRRDLSAVQLETLSNKVGRLAHDAARREMPPPPDYEVESYHLPHLVGEIDWLGVCDGR